VRVLISGSKSFGDTYIVGVLLGGLEDALLPDDKEVVLITGDRKGAEHTINTISESRHSKVRIWSFGKKHRFPRKMMIKTGQPHFAFFFGDLVDMEDDNSVNLMIKCVDANIPTYCILKVDAETMRQRINADG
jgi:hypothetical protein